MASALVAAGERLATASAKLDRAGNDYAKRTTGLALGRLEVLRRLAAPGPDDVVWIERVGRTRRIRIAPIAAGETIGHLLLACHPVIAVSATLGGEPPFPALARQMGFRSDAEPGGWADPDDVENGNGDDDGRPVARAGRGYVAVRTASSFDWRAQGILYVAKDLPDPTRFEVMYLLGGCAPDGVEKLRQRLDELGDSVAIAASASEGGGRYAQVLDPFLEQGERDTGRLAEAFIEDESSVLVGTRSFWAGIDAAGAACVLVVIDRIPFPAPGEPVQDARRTRAQRPGLSPFKRDRPARRRFRPRAGHRSPHPHRDRSRCRRGARSAVGDSRPYRVRSARGPCHRLRRLIELRGRLARCSRNSAAARPRPGGLPTSRRRLPATAPSSSR